MGIKTTPAFRKIDLSSWPRKALFENFLQFDDPFFNICADVEVTALKKYCDRHNASFFLHSYYFMLKAANSIEEFRYRIHDDEVIVYERVRGSCPILKEDRTFGFGYFNFEDNLDDFIESGKMVVDRIKKGIPFDAKLDEDDLIHSSVIPWISFRSIEHAKRLNKGDSVPKIVLGKVHEVGAKYMMPVSVSGHHSLMDGLHAAEFFQHYEEICAQSIP